MLLDDCCCCCAVQTDRTVLASACFDGNLELAKWLVSKGANVNAVSNVEVASSVLQMACVTGNVEVAKWLVSVGANPHYSCVRACVFSCVQSERCDEFLIEQAGHTVLMAAARGGCLEIVKWLVNEHQSDPLAVDDGGMCPAMIACVLGHADVTHYLMRECGASLDAFTVRVSNVCWYDDGEVLTVRCVVEPTG